MNYSHLENPDIFKIIFAVLVHKLGGSVRISQANLDQVAYSRLDETGFTDGSVEFQLVQKVKAS